MDSLNVKYYCRVAFFRFLAWIAISTLPMGAAAQASQCSIINTLTDIERQMQTTILASRADPDLSQDQIVESIQRRIQQAIRNQTPLFVAGQVLGNPNWNRTFLAQRSQALTLYKTEGPRAFIRATSGAEIVKQSRELIALEKLLQCAANTSQATESPVTPALSDQNTLETTSGFHEKPEGALGALTHIISRISNFVSRNVTSIAPWFFLFISLVTIWLVARYESFRAKCRQRFQCHIEAQLLSEHNVITGHIGDISRNGVGLRVNYPVKTGRIFDLKVGDWQRQIRVIHATDNSAGALFLKRLRKIPDEFELVGKKKWIRNAEYNNPAGQ